MATRYKVEIQTMKKVEGKEQEVISSITPYTGDTAEKDAEIAYHDAVSYNMKLDTLESFLVEIITEIGVNLPDQTKFYKFATAKPVE